MISAYKFPEIVLVEFPYVDMHQYKIRPALVLLQSSHQDLVLLRITSNTKIGENDSLIEEFQLAGLNQPSKIQIDKISTIEKVRIKGTIGHLSEKDKEQFINNFKKVYSFL
ncbi:MAG: type II toxin-antitoxin system PemK/MazF family toxin [Candidatus Caenarcaniphilales bacterium]|nr:type II toxin-antitoxin system PemK/MazF family toxin [Candidatus Caenarcaniphilales bacterium]